MLNLWLDVFKSTLRFLLCRVLAPIKYNRVYIYIFIALNIYIYICGVAKKTSSYSQMIKTALPIPRGGFWGVNGNLSMPECPPFEEIVRPRS